jgi:ribokinase
MTEGRVLVAGSINMDIVASVKRHPVPGETLSGRDLGYFPGGKGANQAVAASRAGAKVEMIGAVGDDAFGPDLLKFLEDNGVDTHGVASISGTPTGTALIVVDEQGENAIVVVAGANGLVSPTMLEANPVHSGDVLVAQFETPVDVTSAYFVIGRREGATTILNPAPAEAIADDLLAVVDFLVLNETELATITGREVRDTSAAEEIADACGALRNGGFGGTVVATLGARGAVAVSSAGEILEVSGRAVVAVDTTGAGDCFVGYLASGIARGDELQTALNTANAAAAICVQRPGAGPSMPFESELNDRELVGS